VAKNSTALCPVRLPKPPVAASLQTATLAHSHHGHAGWARMRLAGSPVNPFFLAAFFLCQYWFSALVT